MEKKERGFARLRTWRLEGEITSPVIPACPRTKFSSADERSRAIHCNFDRAFAPSNNNLDGVSKATRQLCTGLNVAKAEATSNYTELIKKKRKKEITKAWNSRTKRNCETTPGVCFFQCFNGNSIST